MITPGDFAAVDGKMKSFSGKQFAFFDIYKFSGFKGSKIKKKMTSFVIELKN